ncbi:MAG: HlyD family secretion protein [Terriglobales bacterium]
MSTGKKLVIFGVMVVVLGGVVAVSLNQQGRDRTTVQTVQAARQDLVALVTASGEITPKTYADISPNNVGQITDLYVKEGDRVRAGELLAKLWNVQQAAQVAGMQASLKTSEANLNAQQAAMGTAQANLDRDTAQLAQVTQDWRRTQALYEDQLLARADYDTKQAAYKTAEAQLKVSQATLKQVEAQVASLQAMIHQSEANLQAASDALSRTEFRSPLTGIVTYLPVHVGDTVVMGIQNSPGSVIMRVADMSVVTAEVQVDETDIANVHIGQAATLTIDAFNDQKFPGTVTEVGDTAILRSTGAAATSSSGSDAQQAKDFKVVITLNQPPPNIRPGLSCTAQITTATAKAAVSVPLQAVVERTLADLNPPKLGTAEAAAAVPLETAPKGAPVQGIFVVRNGAAVFVAAATGISGVDHIQVTSGIAPGDEIITGPFKILRTITNHARIKVDNSLPADLTTTSSGN